MLCWPAENKIAFIGSQILCLPRGSERRSLRSNQRLGMFPPVAVVTGEKTDADAGSLAPYHPAEVHAGVTGDPQPKGFWESPIIVNLQPGTGGRYFAHDARRKRPVERRNNSCLHMRWQARKVSPFLEEELAGHGFARRLEISAPY